MQQITLHVEGMGCRRCVREVTRRLRDVVGVQTVAADQATCQVCLTGTMTLEGALAALAGTVYRVDVVGFPQPGR